jgi:hypothetical protein
MESKDEDGKRGSGVTNLQIGGDAARLATFKQLRGLLFSVAYRMLGSLADAEGIRRATISATARWWAESFAFPS